MTMDYRTMQAPRSKPVGGLLLGLFLGFLLGLATAAAIAVYLLKTPMPFTNKAKPPEKASPATQPLAEVAKPVKPEEGKPRFDFYRILPGHEEPVTSEQLKQAAQAQAKSGAPSPDLYLLQVGAFQNPADADNLKAKLALIGLEANVEPTNLAEKGFWYRVRVGPYSNVDEINRARSLLLQNGVDASLVKIRDAAPTAPKNQQNPQNPQNPQNQ
jgi:cell division protein FtsN